MEKTTCQIAEWIAGFDTSRIREETLARARHAVLDWTGVTIAGAREPLVDILVADALENGESGICSLIGRPETVAPATAALINGAASHALDFDDVNRQLHGHPTVAVLPAVLTLAEQHQSSGRELLDAFIVGYQIACAVGEMVEPDHYLAGWHATGTAGTFGAAAGAARLLGLDAGQCAHALGLAATQAAGLKAMFGTMAKPLHAGKAALNGLLSARWAARGFDANPDAIEAHQGFAHTQTTSFSVSVLPEPGSGRLAVEAGLYKYHAACYLTHASLEAVGSIVSANGFRPDEVHRVEISVLPSLHDVCDIVSPSSGLEIKFSIRHLIAMAIAGVDTATLGSYSDETARRSDLVALRERIELIDQDLPNPNCANVVIRTKSGQRLENFSDVSEPCPDTEAQRCKLTEKFHRLVVPVIGDERTGRLVSAIDQMDQSPAAVALFGV